MSLSVCSRCSRHVRTSPNALATCPFCGGGVAYVAVRARARASRAARLAGVAVIGVACSSEHDYAADAAYGGPPFDAGQVDAADAALYGVTPFDASSDADGATDAADGADAPSDSPSD